jgi:hypothetical protein
MTSLAHTPLCPALFTPGFALVAVATLARHRHQRPSSPLSIGCS